MGDFSRKTFDKMKHYVGVRLQQGVPIIDADWNEQEDIRKYELQAFLKWFVGNGVPLGNDGFRILAVAGANDFAIQGGDGTPEGAGRCLVEGWDVVNENTIHYTAQQLFIEPDLSNRWDVTPLEELAPPEQGERTDQVYVDVWEREVDASEDAHLVNPAIGVEACVRVKREWVVRIAQGEPIPSPAPEHVFYHLADIHRTAGEAIIQQEHITDRRLTGLSIASYYDMQQTLKDAFGGSYVLDHDGQPNLNISLRDAINALLRGGLPGTPEIPLGESHASPEHPSAVEDDSGNIWVFWHGSVSRARGIWYNRYQRTSDTWDRAIRLTVTTASDRDPFALKDPRGDIWVFWSRGNTEIWYNRYRSASDTWEGAKRLTTTTGVLNEHIYALADREGRNIWVFWRSNRNGKLLATDIYYNRFRLNTNTWEGDHLLPMPTAASATDQQPCALEDRDGDIWVFWNGANDIWTGRFNGVTAVWEFTQLTATTTAEDQAPHAFEDRQGNIWVFWQSTTGTSVDIWYRRYFRARDLWELARPLTAETESDERPFTFEDRRGDIWVVWHSSRSGNTALWYNRLRADGGWDRAIQLTASGRTQDLYPVALVSKDEAIWVFWQRQDRDDHDIWYRTLITAIEPYA